MAAHPTSPAASPPHPSAAVTVPTAPLTNTKQQAPPRQTRRRSALRIAAPVILTIVIFLFFGSVWLNSAANAAFISSRWAYGVGSHVTAVTKDFALLVSVSLGLGLHAMFLMGISQNWRRGSRKVRDSENGEAGGGGGRNGHENDDAALVPTAVALVVIAIGLLTQLLAPVIGHIIVDTVLVVSSVIFCFVTGPTFMILLARDAVAVAVAVAEKHQTSTGSH